MEFSPSAIADRVKAPSEAAHTATVDALEQAGLSDEIRAEELPFVLTGLRSIYPRIRANRLDSKLGVEPEPLTPEAAEDLDLRRLDHFNQEAERRADNKAQADYEKKLTALHIPAPPEARNQGTPKEEWLDPEFEFDEDAVPFAESTEEMLMLSVENDIPFLHREDVERVDDFNERLAEQLRAAGMDEESLQQNQAHTVKGAWELAKKHGIPYITTGREDVRLDRFNQALQDKIVSTAKVERQYHAARGTLDEFVFDESSVRRAHSVDEMWKLAAAYKIQYTEAFGTSPQSRKEWRVAQRPRRQKELLQAETSALRAMESGVYRIDPATKKSKARETDPELEGLAWFDWMTAESEEARYASTLKETEHLLHELGVGHGHHPSKREIRQKRARDKHKQRLEKIELAKDLKPVRKAARKAHRTDIRRERTDRKVTGLEHRKDFYEELGDVLERDSVGRDEKTTMRRLKIGRGGASEGAARLRGSWHKNVLDYSGSKNHPQRALGRKKKMETLSTRYTSHRRLTSRTTRVGETLSRREASLRQRRNQIETRTRDFVDKVNGE